MNNNRTQEDKTSIIIMGLMFYVIAIYLLGHFMQVYDPNENIMVSIQSFMPYIEENFMTIHIPPVKLMGIAALFLFIFINIKTLEIKKQSRYRDGVEKGSAKWNTDMKTYNKVYTSPKGKQHNNGENNMIITDDVFLSMDGRQTQRNNNIVVVGGSGAGKSRFFVKPNLLQANSSYVITDPSGELLESTGAFLKSQGYEIRVFNLVDMDLSDTYNPFNYIRNEEGVITMVDAYMKNASDKSKSGGDEFWAKSEAALLQAICYYLHYELPMAERHFGNVARLIKLARLDSEDESTPTILDIMMDDLREKDPEHMAVAQYDIFKQAPGKTAMSILISTAVRLAPFQTGAVKRLISSNTMDLTTVGDKKVALFCITPVVSTTYNFLIAMMYNQLFETLYYHAEKNCKGKRLPVHVRFLLDEFANIGTIPDFEQKLATMRKYEISCSIILQNMAQLKTIYKDSWESITGNCDTFLFLGGQEQTTLEYVSKKLGKETILIKDYSINKGKGAKSKNISVADRDLMTSDEIARMPNTHCISFIRGVLPFYSKKYDYLRHENYKLTGDAKDDNLYNINKLFPDNKKMKRKPIIRSKENLVKREDMTNTTKRSSFKEGNKYFTEEGLAEKLTKENINTISDFEENIEIHELYNPDFEFDVEDID